MRLYRFPEPGPELLEAGGAQLDLGEDEAIVLADGFLAEQGHETAVRKVVPHERKTDDGNAQPLHGAYQFQPRALEVDAPRAGEYTLRAIPQPALPVADIFG
ncbi:hypothetical protein D3C86_1810150 [compost metagenome]